MICLYCQEPFHGKRVDAKFCCPQHRKNYSKRLHNPKKETDKRLPYKETDKRLLNAKQETDSSRLSPLMSSASCEWYTPPHIVDRAVLTMQYIDLDPCSNSHDAPNIPATQHFTQDNDGLRIPWHGRVWMNPPYGRELVQWVEKLVTDFEQGRVEQALALVPARTDTRWFALFRDYPTCFIRGRLKFSGADNSATFPSAVIALGIDVDVFTRHFADVGDIWQRVREG